MNDDRRDLNPPANAPATQNSGGPNGSSNDIRNFMPSFRSALSQIDRLNAVSDNGNDSYSANPMDIIPSSSTSGDYYGYRPAGLLSLALALTSRQPMSAEGRDDMGYEDETQFEAGYDYVRMGYSRRMNRQTGHGQTASSRMGVQMMMGPGGFGVQMFSSGSRPRASGVGLQTAQMLQEYHDRHCPFHGSERHKHAPADDDGYTGPIITEISDDEETGTERENLALPSSSVPSTGKCGTNKNAYSNKNMKVNKNAVCRRNETIINNATKLVDDDENEDLDGTDWMNQVENISKQKRNTSHLESPVHDTTPKKNALRRRNLDPYGHDNRQPYEHDDRSAQHCRVSIPLETSNVRIILFKPDTVPTVYDSQNSGLSDTPKQVKIQCLPGTKLDSNGEAILNSIKQSDEWHGVQQEDRLAPESVDEQKIDLISRPSIDVSVYREDRQRYADMEAEGLTKETQKETNVSPVSCSNDYLHGDGNTVTHPSSVLYTDKHIKSPNKKISTDAEHISDKGNSTINSIKSNLENIDQKQSNAVKFVGKAQNDGYGDKRSPNKNIKKKKEYDKDAIRETDIRGGQSLNATDTRGGQSLNATVTRGGQSLNVTDIRGGQSMNATDNKRDKRGQGLNATDIRGDQSLNTTDNRGGQSMNATDISGGQPLKATDIRGGQSVNTADIRGGQRLNPTDNKRVQSLNTTDIRGGQSLNTSDNRGGQSLNATDIRGDQSMNAIDIRGGQPLNATEIRGGQSLNATDIRGDQPLNATDIRGGQSLNATDIRGVQPLNATDIRGGQPLNATDIIGGQPLNATDIRGGQRLNTTDIRGGQSLNTTDTRGDQSLNATDIRGSHILNATDIRGGQSLNVTDIRGGQRLITTDTREDQSLNATDIRGGQPLNATDIIGCQSKNATDIRGGQSLNATDIRGGQPLNATDIRGGQPLNSTDFRGGQPLNATDIRGGQSLNANDIRGDQPLNATDIRGGQSLNATDIRGVQPLNATDIRGGQPLNATDIIGGQPLNATDIRGGQRLNTTDIRGGQSLNTTDTRGDQSLNATDIRGSHILNATDIRGGQSLNVTDIRGGQRLITTDTREDQSLNATDIRGGQPLNATDIIGCQSKNATDIRGGQSLNATDIRGGQPLNATDIRGGQPLNSTDFRGGQPLNATDIRGGQSLNANDIRGCQSLNASGISGSKSLNTTDIRVSQCLNTTDIRGSQSLNVNDIRGGQPLNATDISGSQSMNAPDIRGSQSMYANDIRGGQSRKTTDIRGGQSMNATDIRGGQPLDATVNPDFRILFDTDVKDNTQSEMICDSERKQYHASDSLQPQKHERVKLMPRDSAESSMDTASDLASITTVNQNINTFPKERKDHSIDESANAPPDLSSYGVFTETQASNGPTQSTQKTNINKFEIHSTRSSEPTKISFNQMIKSQLPPNISSSECDDVLKANFQREDIQPNPISQIFQSKVEQSTVSRKDISYVGALGELDETFRNTENFANRSRNYVHNKTQINMVDGNVRQNKSSHEMKNSYFGTESNVTVRQQSTGGCETLGRYVSQCTGCGNIHIHCKCCDGILLTMCGDCPTCDTTLTSILNEGQSTTVRQGQPASVHHYGHKPSQRQALGYGDGEKHSNGPDVVLSQSQHHIRTQHGTSTVAGRGKNVTGSHGSSSNMAVSMSNGSYVEEQHPLDDSIFDHPEWNHLKQDETWNVSDKPTQQKPRRNKNLTVRQSPASQRNGASGSPSTETQTHINSPNFTTSSYQHSYGRSKGTSSYQSNFDDSYYQRSSSTDRLSNLSEIMLKKGMVVKDVYPDGNCFFAAVVDQLRVRGEFYYTAKSLRQAAVAYLRKHSEQEDGTPLLEFVSDHETTTWEGYLTRLTRDGEWADHIIISAISNVLKRRLVIHSLRRTDQQINKTIMEPNQRKTSHGPQQPKTNKQSTEPTQGKRYPIEDKISEADAEQDDTGDDNDEDDDAGDSEEMLEDVMLGHIPEAHYVSLRYADWEDKLFTSLRARKNEPQTILTMYDQSSTKRTQGGSTDSNKDLDGHASIPSFCQLPNDHFNFLFKYLRNGNFIEANSYSTYNHPSIPKEVKSFYTTWCVGDRPNELESYLVTDTKETNTARFYYDNAITPLVWFMAFPHDIVVSKKDINDELKPKQLIPDETGCKLGYLKLKPVIPRIWGDQLRQKDDINYLRHLHIKTNPKSNIAVPVHVAFKCDWPEQAMDCKEQMKKLRIKFDNHNTTMQQKVIDGVRVIPVCSQTLTCNDPDCVEWKYSFDVIEQVISMNIITADARFCFKIMNHFLSFVFNNKEVITKEHIKAVFFHTCADLDIGHGESGFLEIVSHFMSLLETFLKDRNVPDFFMRPINLIETVAVADIGWHYERTRVVKEQYLVYMFLFLDQKGLMEQFSLSKCFDGLLFDAQQSTRNTDRCFERLTVMEACEWVLNANFNMAKTLIAGYDTGRLSDEEEEEDEIGHGESENKSKLHKRVMNGLPLQEQWLYAFFLEFETGLPLLAHVCDQHKGLKLKDLFGEMMIDIILSDQYSHFKNRDIELPTDIAQQEGIASFAVQFSSVLRSQIYCRSAYVAGIHFFLSQHSDVLLTNITPEDNNGYSKCITSLFQLHNNLYQYYKSNNITDNYSNLMIPYSRLCDYQPTVAHYEWLADLWNYFGDDKNADAARMKANAMRENQYAKETRM